MKVLPGDTLSLFSPEIIEKSLLSYSNLKGKKFRVSGIFQTNIKDYDSQLAFTSFDGFAGLFGKKSNTVSLDIKLYDFKLATDKKAQWLQQYPNLSIKTWIDLNKALYDVMKFEKAASFLVIGLIIIIAIFNILASLTMSVIEKRKDIAVLMAMGADAGDIRKIFRNTGIFIGIISSVAGSLLGIGLCIAQEKFKLFTVNSGLYFIDAIPVSLNYWDVVATLIFTLLLSALATYFPAQRAATTDVVSSFRSE
jgi:lipoprotein-releasing system permease protein